ncbi:hypothetical protein HZB60_07400 [candidate division KSB1 bacterium]|nr:hypothetical protein [candidate division KSB1 bacterium]
MIRILLTLVISVSSLSVAADDAARVYRDLERHLRTLSSLDIHYQAAGTAFADGPVSGRMLWLKPDKFYHDTPDWTLCEHDGEQWRHLKAQNTVILEFSAEREWLPETMLLNLSKDLDAAGLDIEPDGRMLLRLTSDDATAPTNIVLEFAAGSAHPDVIRYLQPDGAEVSYAIKSWDERAQPAASLFVTPEVPAENLIDFRLTKPER